MNTSNRNTVKNIAKSIRKIGLVCFALFIANAYLNIQGTNAFFTSKSSIGKNSVSSGYWIPELTMTVSPKNPDGDGGSYKTTPCVTLSADINSETDGIKVYYEFSSDRNPIDGGKEYEGNCIEIPDGDPTHFQAQAVNEENDDWKSNIVSQDFRVKTILDPGAVVINELMWMGVLGDENDEWIELRNMTDNEIDLSNWRILNGGSGSGHIEIPHGYYIKANGYFLITKKKWDKTEINLSKDLEKDEGMTNTAGMSLKNSSEKLTLEDKNKNVIDTVWKDFCHWPAGWHGLLLHMSMERNKKPGNGESTSNWHTCVDHKCNGKTYWDHEGFNFGTPGEVNLSVNDPTDSDFDPASMEQKIEDEQDDSLDKVETPAEILTETPIETPAENPDISKEPKEDEIIFPSTQDNEKLNTEDVLKPEENSDAE